MAFSEVREVAWHSWDEWNYVRQLLYNFDSLDSMIKGVNIVCAWKGRLRLGNMPISIELTASLVETYISYLHQIDDQKVSEHQVSLSIAMALVRFINGITDQYQTGLYAQSVQLIADKINIPDWMVDLRHQATHSQLPSLELLKSGLLFALSWLYTAYWNEILEKLELKNQDTYITFRKLLSDYNESVFIFLNAKEMKSPKSKDKKVKAKSYDIFNSISQAIKKLICQSNLSVFISILTEQGFFVFNGHQISDLKIFSADAFSFASNGLLEVGHLWKPLFSLLSEIYPNFTQLVLCELTSLHNTNANLPIKYMIAIYVLYQIDKTVKDDVVNFFLTHPSKYGFIILDNIFDNLKSDKKRHFESFKMFQIFRPVIHALDRPLPIRDVDLELSDSFQKCASLIVNEKHQTLSTNTSVKHGGWQVFNKLKLLPPMGEFYEKRDIFYLDTSIDHSHSNVTTVNQIGNDTTDIPSNKRLQEKIDNLFTIDSIQINKNLLIFSASTDGYHNREAPNIWVDHLNSKKQSLKENNIGANNSVPDSPVDVNQLMFF